MKCVLLSVRPEWVSKILNGEKTIEIRKKFPKDYVGWVYIYCTKGKEYCYHAFEPDACTMENVRFFPMTECNGKVVARFWCDKVEDIFQWDGFEERYFTKSFDESVLLKKSCLSFEEMRNYAHNHSGYAIHITKLEIFDKPKEINKFYGYSDKKHEINNYQEVRWLTSLTRAPQSWQFIEV